MFNSNIIDVAIGLVFIFLLLSLVCSAAHEIIEALMKARAANLERGIQELAGNNSQAFVTKLYSHGLINSLFKGTYTEARKKGFFTGRDLPSYIPSKNFALAVIDLKNTGAELPQNIKDALQAFERVAGQDVAQLQRHLEEWFNTAMDRVSGWYKRRSQWIVLVLGLASAIAVNADCIAIAKRLSTNSNLRKSVEELAESTMKDMPAPNAGPPAGAGSQTTDTTSPTPGTAVTPGASPGNPGEQGVGTALRSIQQHLGTLDAIGLPVGRDYSLKSPTQLWTATRAHWLGWLITALAISLGAPFWFDMLNKIMIVRSTVKPSEKSGDEASKDAKRAPTSAAVPDAPVPKPDPGDGN
jgi:hypothetical protein